MTKWKNPCNTKTPKCDCEDTDCNHVCCGAVRDRARRRMLSDFKIARGHMTPGSPAYKSITKDMRFHGYEDQEEPEEPETNRDLNDEFHDTDPHAAMTAILGDGMKNTLKSQERENDLNRLIATIPALDQAADVYQAMNFFYRTECEAKVGDAELRFKAAIHRCSVVRFTNILRQAPFTVNGWNTACIAVLTSIDKHYLASAKTALKREMKQHMTEDPSLYEDRVMMRTDVYKHFAELRGKSVDEEEIARNWIAGLVPKAVRMAAAVATANMTEYAIKDALDVARVAHDACTTAPADSAPLQAMIPGAPDIDSSYLQECMSQMNAQLAAMADQNALAATNMADRLASMQQTSVAPVPTKFPCRNPVCNGALHRYKDCPLRAPCNYCESTGHPSSGCWKEFPHLDPRTKGGNSGYRPRERHARDHERERSPDRRRARERSRDKDRTRSTAQDAAKDKDGKRLNEKGSR